MIQSVTFTSAAFEVFARGISVMFFSICLSKKMPIIKFLGIFNSTSLKINYICLKKKSNVSNISNIFKLDFIMQIIYCIIQIFLYSLYILFCSLISVSQKQNIETMLTLPYSYNWQIFDNKMNEKKNPGVSEY